MPHRLRSPDTSWYAVRRSNLLACLPAINLVRYAHFGTGDDAQAVRSDCYCGFRRVAEMYDDSLQLPYVSVIAKTSEFVSTVVMLAANVPLTFQSVPSGPTPFHVNVPLG